MKEKYHFFTDFLLLIFMNGQVTVGEADEEKYKK